MSAVNKKLQVLGPHAPVIFVDQEINDVPAKIDTGADSSSVWASDIKEKNGVLQFVLFDPTAPWYNGQRVSTKDYEIRSIKNSFGVSEFRYKVPLKIILNGRTIKVLFTLAARANSRYPVLIGRRTLKSRFVVDVAMTEKKSTQKQILILVHKGKKIYSEVATIAKNNKNFLIDVVKYEDLMVSVDGANINIKNAQNGKSLTGYKLIYFLTRVRDSEVAAIVAVFARRYDIAYIDRAAALLPTDTKAHQAALLSGHQLGIPKTIYIDKNYWEYHFDEAKKTLGLPFVFKDNNGLKGRNNYLIKTKKQFIEACENAKTNNLQMIAQEFIPSDGYFRFLVMGKSAEVIVYRKVDQKKGHVYKRTADNLPKLVDPKELQLKVRQAAVLAADILQLDVAGVDIVQDKISGLWYCLEVNNSPQIVSAAFVEEKIEALTRFFIRKTNK